MTDEPTLATPRDYEVTFTMRAGEQKREFSLVIPALDRQAAADACYHIQWGVNEASGHLWKIHPDDTPRVTEIDTERSST